MSTQIIGTRGALILAAAAIICTGMVIYFSPYHSCVRSFPDNYSLPRAAMSCVTEQ